MGKYRLISLACCVVLGASMLTGCSLFENPEIKEVTNKVVDTVKNNEYLNELAQGLYEEVMVGLYGKENLEIKEIETTDDYIKLEITAPNLKTIFEDVFEEYEEELSLIKGEKEITEFLQEKINEVLEENKFETVTNEVQVEQTTDENGDVEIVENEEYIEAISGGLSDLYQAYQDKLADKQSNNN